MSLLHKMTEKYIDIHCHMLPGVDDGADSWELCRRMLQTSVEEGAEAIILTPHYYPGYMDTDGETVAQQFAELKGRLTREWQLDVQVYLGSELYYSYDTPAFLANGIARTLADSRYILVEFSPGVRYQSLRQGLTRLLENGYYVILAHLERYDTLYQDFDRVEELYNMGVYLQANARPVCGKDGRHKKAFLKALLDQEMLSFIATDAHDMRARAPQMADCAAYLCKKYSADYARWLLYENPTCILENRKI